MEPSSSPRHVFWCKTRQYGHLSDGSQLANDCRIRNWRRGQNLFREMDDAISSSSNQNTVKHH
ncbi:conserved hypothetical protein [Ricinus communis]|uniref:Uncharacterized protein n=1 Tax=Ricinus communis TaxID=3988 RepID=B9R810_RICCO|nr:conserved hypothetical protein [Ricinus communis]